MKIAKAKNVSSVQNARQVKKLPRATGLRDVLATSIVAGEYLYLFGKTGQSMTIKLGERYEEVAADNRV